MPLKKSPLASPFRRAKIVCTLGPASSTAQVIGNLIDEGMDVARLNFSHGNPADHEHNVALIREEARRRGRAVAILQDLQGPKIRVGKIVAGTELVAGSEFILTTDDIMGDAARASTTYENLPHDVKAGDLMLIDDGLLQLEVLEIENKEVITRVLIGGKLSNNKGINLPGIKVSAPSLSEKDHADLIFGQRLGVDFLALSFVRCADDILVAKEAILKARQDDPVAQKRSPTPIIAKIEKPEAIENLAEIIEVADGIMIARGDLGVELGPEKVPLIQKAGIEMSNARGKLVITATQMLESMTANARPTRAEASDVANAILDGTDAVMLSAETASGRYPLLAVRTMSSIVREVEQSLRFHEIMAKSPALTLAVPSNAVAHAAVVAARLVHAPVIVAISDSGGAVRLISEYRPEALVIGVTSLPDVYNQLAAYWGVLPLLLPMASTANEMLTPLVQLIKELNLAQSGEMAVFTMALPFGRGQSTNTMQIRTI